MSREIKDRKAKLAKMDLTTEQYAKHCYRTIKSGNSVTRTHNNNTMNNPNNIENIENHFNKHKGSVYNYRMASKAASKHSNRQQINASDDLENEQLVDVHLHTNSDMDDESDSIIHQQQQNEANRLMQARSMIIFADDEKEQLLKRQEKQRQRIAQARLKILSDPAAKNNLNKMTILQPFEDTKILINIDKVPSKILNSLLNKQHTAPRYYMPPVRAFGYFRNVISTKAANKSNENVNSMFTPCSSRSSVNVTRQNRSPKHKKHFFDNSNSSNPHPAHTSTNQTRNQHRSSSQRSIKYESLQTLSQIHNPFYTNNPITSSSKEVFQNGKNNNGDDSSTSNAKHTATTNRTSNLNGISIK